MSGIKVLFTNAQSMVNKINEIRAVTTMLGPDIIAITETWMNENIDNSYLHINGYEIVSRNDRVDTDRGRGGGVIVYGKKEMLMWEVEARTDFCQCATMKIKVKNTEINFHAIYRSPNSTNDNDDELCRWVTEMRGINILIGDFNFPEIVWEDGRAGARGRPFFEAVSDRFMQQHVEGETHISGNTLDLILSDTEDLVSTDRCQIEDVEGVKPIAPPYSLDGSTHRCIYGRDL